MIKGSVEIIKTYKGKDTTLFSDSNMVVDGLRKTIADVMTFMPNPSANSVGTGVRHWNGVSSVSSYQIQAMTIGSAKDYYTKRDSRFIFSSQATSSQNYQLMTPKDDDLYPLFDVYSGVGFNQWRYDNQVDANLLQSPTLGANIFAENSAWEITYADDPSPNPISVRPEVFSEDTKAVTRFELNKGQQMVTLRQRCDLSLGKVYTLYSNTKAHNATFDIRIGRAKNGIVLEYYNFDTGKFMSTSDANKYTYHKVSPKNYFSVDEFKFKLHGHTADSFLFKGTEYYVEYLFPSHGFVDETFTPWEENYMNPHVDVVRLEVCENDRQILRNPNFLELQSQLLNNDFVGSYPFLSRDVKNAPACEQEGLKGLISWRQVNPLATHGPDPTSTEDSVGLGFVKPITPNDVQGTPFSDAVDGVRLYASSIDVNSSGAASISQTFSLNDSFKNQYAYLPGNNTDPVLIDAGFGQADNDQTLMLKFDTMASSNTTAANSGYLEISLQRELDGAFYQFSGISVGDIKHRFGQVNVPMKFNFSELQAWKTCSVPVSLPSDANRKAYTLRIAARGRTDAEGFVHYAIRNFSFGRLEGWRTFNYDKSGAGNYALSSNSHARVTPGHLFSSLVFTSPLYSSLKDGEDEIKVAVDDSFVKQKNQIVQNFRGMEPTKTYRLVLKGTGVNATTIPEISYVLKAKSRGQRDRQNYNVLGPWYMDSANYSATNVTSKFNPYVNNSESQRRTFPKFARDLESKFTKPTDWGILLNSSSTDTNQVCEEDIRADEGEYTLSMNVFNQNEHGGYFVLSSAPAYYYNWDNNDWDDLTGSLTPSYRNSVSGSYFLELPKGRNSEDYTSFTHPEKINIGFPLQTHDDKTLDGLGSRGKFKLGAGLFGPNASAGATMVNDISLKGVGLGANVDVWKEKYYDFTNQQWVTGMVSGTDEIRYSQDGGTARSFMSTPKLISNMCFAGLDRDTEYQLNIIDTAGGNYLIHEVSLTDVSLVTNRGRERWVRDADKFTSEPYADSQYNLYENGVVMKMFKNGLLSDTNNVDSMSIFLPWDFQMFNNGRTFSKGDGNAKKTRVCFQRTDNWTTETHSPWYIRDFTLGEYGLEGGEQIALGWESASPPGDCSANIAVEAKYGGTTYVYDFGKENWVPGTERREQQSAVRDTPGSTGGVSSTAFINYCTHTLSPKIKVPMFGPNTKITFSFRAVKFRSATTYDWDTQAFNIYRFTDATPGKYRVEGDTFLFPEFPRPEDDSLQSKGASGNPDELGHFLNRIQYFSFSAAQGAGEGCSSIVAYNNPMAPSPTGEKTFEQAVSMGAYLPSAGLWFGSGTYGLTQKLQQAETHGNFKLQTGILNTMGVVNSDGYIYRHPYSVSSYHDASAGFLASSVSSTIGGTDYGGYGLKQNRYILKIHKDDWRFLTYYMGGLGALGLHTIDYQKTYNKLGTVNQLTHYRPTGASQYTTGKQMPLYNVADPTQNPIFTLCNKKVTFPPGLHIDYDNTDVITIIWDINFMSERKV